MSFSEKNKTSRHVAVLCLTVWEKERQAVQPFIDSMIHGSGLAASDRHLAVMLVQGVLRHMEYLDCIIGRFSKHPMSKMKPLTRMVLRVGAFQLLFLDRVPESAAVNETVKVMRAEKQPGWMVNFVNGVLRTLSRKKEELPGPDRAGENGGPTLNHPAWLVGRWRERYGDEKTVQICRLNNLEPRLVLRVNTLLTSRDALADSFREAGVDVQAGQYAPDSLVVVSLSGPVFEMGGYEKGLFHVQDEAAQLVALLLGPFVESGQYLDACAGLGGKSCQLGQLLPEGAGLWAVEPNSRRFQLLRENLQRLGLENRVRCVAGTIGELAEGGKEKFHGILVDAPCSGIGVIRRHPDIRWNRDVLGLQSYQEQQLAILREAASLLLPGGILVYATCSMEPEENEQVVDAFVRANPAFMLTNATDFLPEQAAGLVNPAGYLATTPVDGLDGFFGARLVRCGGCVAAGDLFMSCGAGRYCL